MSLESDETIDYILDLGGIDCIFESFTIKAIIGFRTTMLFRNESVVSGTENQDFNFRTSVKIAVDNDLVEGMLFSIQDRTYMYNFKIANTPIPQMDGWVRFPAYYINKELI